MSDWHGCYKKGWSGTLVPEAFAHPAKISFGLAERIYNHAIEEGWLSPGDTIVDPFGGIGGCGFHAAIHGMHFIGCELEQRFVDLAQANIEKWKREYGSLPGYGTVRVVQGDSRELAKVVTQAMAAISSPPFSTPDCQPCIGQGTRKDLEARGKTPEGRYGYTPGNLASMKMECFDSVVSSPPYESTRVVDSSTQNGDISKIPEYLGQYGAGTTNRTNQDIDDFWTAARQIVDQTFAVLRPGGHAIWIVKAFVKDKKIVPFPVQWRQLCEAAGFVTVHEHRAWLVEEKGTQYSLVGEAVTKRTERKSFFRMLAEKKGSPRIDWEVVLCMVKPCERRRLEIRQEGSR